MARRFELLDGDRIIREEHIHWKNYLSSLLTVALCLVLVLVRMRFRSFSFINMLCGMNIVGPELNSIIIALEGVLLLVAIFAALFRLMQVNYIKYYLTNRRIIITSGIVSRNFEEMLLEKCEMVYLHQNPYERMYDCGDIVCVSAGGSIMLDDVREALAFKKAVLEMMGENKKN
jgi:membrane protein YdbS with pleckstrin-like domain